MLRNDCVTDEEVNDLSVACAAFENGDSVTCVTTPTIRAYMRWMATNSDKTDAPCSDEQVVLWIKRQKELWPLVDKLNDAFREMDRAFMAGESLEIPAWRFEPWAETLLHPWASELDVAVAEAFDWLSVG